MKIRLITTCLVLLATWGCAHPELTRRYHSRTFVDPPRNHCVIVTAFTMDVPGEKPQSLFASLAPQGQQALIEGIAKNPSSSEFIQTIKNIDSGGKGPFIDKTVFNKRVVFGVIKNPPGKEKEDLTLADRINILQVTLKSQKGVFDNWNKFETDYKTVDLGTIGRTQKVTTQVEAYMGPAAQSRIPGQIKGSLTGEKDITETVPLHQQYIHLSGTISPEKDQADLYQEGVVGIDLTGTFSVDFKLQAPNIAETPTKVVLFRSLNKEAQTPKQPQTKGLATKQPEGVQLDFAYIKYVKKDDKIGEPAALKCMLSYDYLLRHVVTKERETVEGLHDVHFWKGSVPAKEITLVSADELKATVFGIYMGNRDAINLEDPYGSELSSILQFGDYASAQDFLRWIKETQNTTVAKYKMYYGPHADKTYLIKDDIPLLNVKPVGLNYTVTLPQ